MSATLYASDATLYVPVRREENSDALRVVSVPLSALPIEVDDVTDILVSEIGPPDLYLGLANQYYLHGMIDQFKAILSSLTTDEARTVYQSVDQKAGLVNVLNALAGLEIWSGWKLNQSTNQSARVEHFQAAIQHLNVATTLDFAVPMTWVQKGMLLIAQGLTNQSTNQSINQSIIPAERSFDSGINYDNDKRNSLAFIGKAICQFAKRQYKDMLQSINQSIFNNPRLPNSCWFALGLAYLSIKDQSVNQSMAKQVFERMLVEDPTEVNALVGLALIKLNEGKDILIHHSSELVSPTNSQPVDPKINQSIQNCTQEALRLLGHAYSHDSFHPMCLLLLADHYYHQSITQSNNQNDLSAIKTLCERGLESVDQSFHSIRCEFYYQLGRMHQSINQTIEAYQLYELARTEAELHDKELIEINQSLNHKSGKPIDRSNQAANKPQCRHPLVLLGHAQMSIATDRWKDARGSLELLRSINQATNQHDSDVDRVLGGVYMHFGLFDQAEPLLQSSLQSSPLDVELLVEWALCCQQIDRLKPTARLAYQRALDTIESINQTNNESDEQVKHPPAQLVHNLAVVCHELGAYAEAKQHYERAIAIVEDQSKQANNGSATQSIHPATITSRYNLAILNHHVALSSYPSISAVPADEMSAIIASYQSIIDQTSNNQKTYLDAYLRLGQLYLQLGKMSESEKCFSAALSHNSRHLEARSLKAQWLHLNGRLREAEREYNQICMLTASGSVRVVDEPDKAAEEEEDEEALLKGDPYAKIALGNLYYEQGRTLARSMQPSQSLIKLKLTKSMAASSDPLKPEFWTGRAAGYFRSVLGSDPKNVYAAHGLGCILASQGEKQAAKEIFTAVKEVASECVEATINLAHTLAQQQLYAPAIKLYEDSMNKLEQNASTAAGENAQDVKVQVLMSMAKTHYAAGQLNEALQADERALLLKPRESVLWYNRAILQEEYAVATLQKSTAVRTLNEVQLSVDRLQDSIDTFTILRSAGQHMIAARREYRAKKAAAAPNTKIESTEFPDMSIDVVLTPDSFHCPPAAALDTRTCEFELDKRAAAHLDFSRSTHKSAVPHLEHAKKRAAEMAEAALRAAQAREQEIENQRLAAEAAEAARLAEFERAEAIARENQAKLQALHADWEATRKMEEQDDDMIDASVDGDEEQGKGRKKKKGGKKKRSNVSDDDGDEEQSRRKRSKHSRSRSRSTSRTRDGEDQSNNQTDDQTNDQTNDGEEGWQKLRESRQKKANQSNDQPEEQTSSQSSKRRGRLQRLNEDEAEEAGDQDDEETVESTEQTDEAQTSVRKRRAIAEDEDDENDQQDDETTEPANDEDVENDNGDEEAEQTNDQNDEQQEEEQQDENKADQTNEQSNDQDEESLSQSAQEPQSMETDQS